MERIEDVAARQQNLVTAIDLYRCGIRRKQIEQKVLNGEWRRVYRGIFALQRRPLSHRQKEELALIWAGPEAVISHAGAARRHGFDGFANALVEVTYPHSRRLGRPPRGIRAHRSRRMPKEDICIIDGVRVTTAARAIVDLGQTCAKVDIAIAIEGILRKATLGMALAKLMWRLYELAQGRDQTRWMQWYLRKRRGADSTDSRGEARLLFHLVQAKIPFILHVRTYGEGGFIGEIDFFIKDRRLAVELDGAQHGARLARLSDYVRDRSLMIEGIRCVRFVDREVRLHPEAVIAEIKALAALRPAPRKQRALAA